MSGQQQVQQDKEVGSAGEVGKPASVIGVLGAGTMGSGIAQLAARSGARTLLFDPLAEALEHGVDKARGGLEKEAGKGRISPEQAHEAAANLQAITELTGLADCELIIEAVPERLELKHELFRILSQGIVSERCVLASNTSSLLVTAIAAAASHPERVVGMHFFNPAPLMKLLEVVAGVESSEHALKLAHLTGEAMGKTVIRAADGPGFLVNRSNRPFGLEALRLLQEQIADIETIDRIVRLEGGFRMGPFELMDLVGIETGLEISKSFYEQSFGEPRWRPSQISAKYVAAGLYGRKSGRGYYDYLNPPHRPEDPGRLEVSGPTDGEGLIVITGQGVLARQLRQAAQVAGYEVQSSTEAQRELPALILQCEGDRTQIPGNGPRLILCDRGSLARLDPNGASVGFHVLPPFGQANLVELTRTESSSPAVVARAERFFATLAKHVEWVSDAPGLVLGRIVCQLINEAAFSLGERVGSAKDIDTGMVLGLNHPRGPLTWADEIGLDHVLAVLDGLWEEYREERYRPAPVLRRLVLTGRLGRDAGSGFHDYPA